MSKYNLAPFLLLAFVAQHSKAQGRPWACEILKVISKDGQAFYNAKPEITLIDTNRFFTPECNGSFGRYHISVVNSNAPHTKGKEQFYVSLGTNKNGFAVGIYRWPNNSIIVYWLNIQGRHVTISKIKEGDF